MKNGLHLHLSELQWTKEKFAIKWSMIFNGHVQKYHRYGLLGSLPCSPIKTLTSLKRPLSLDNKLYLLIIHMMIDRYV